MSDKALAILEQFCIRLESIYGLYQETIISFKNFSMTWRERVNNKNDSISRDNILSYGFGKPNSESARYAYKSKVGEIIDRCDWGGKNHEEIGRLIIVMTFSVWEHEVRPKLAKTLGVAQNEISNPVFGDLRLYRQAVVHVSAKLDKPTEVLAFAQPGDEVKLSYDDMRALFSSLIEAVQEIAVTWCGQRIDYQFMKSPGELS